MPNGAEILKEFFSIKEIRCKGTTCGCGGNANVDKLFAKNILKLRRAFNKPMSPTSFCRCKVHNDRQANSARKSFHISDLPQWPGLAGCAAVDIACPDMSYKVELAALAWELGFRLGYHPSFLHIDGGAHHGYMAQSIFKYAVVSDEELANFKADVLAKIKKG